MSLDALTQQIKRDRADGFAPFFVVATAGTTNAGTIDNLWEIVNQTPLPVVCFRDRKFSGSNESVYLNAIADDLVSSGEAWISTTRLSGTVPVLRACITNYRTQEKEVKHLVAILCQAREKLAKKFSI